MAILIYRGDWIRRNSLFDIFDDSISWLDTTVVPRSTALVGPQRESPAPPSSTRSIAPP